MLSPRLRPDGRGNADAWRHGGRWTVDGGSAQLAGLLPQVTAARSALCRRPCQRSTQRARAAPEYQHMKPKPTAGTLFWAGFATRSALRVRRGRDVPRPARLSPPPDAARPWREGCRMRLRTPANQGSKASTIGLAGGLAGCRDGRARCCAAATLVHAGARTGRIRRCRGGWHAEGVRCDTWLPAHCAGMPFRPGPTLQVAVDVT